MMTYPTLEQKAQIIENTVETLKALGYENPKIAAVAAVEKVNPKMPETVEARELKEMNERGEIKDCVVEGPISLDIALDKSVQTSKVLKARLQAMRMLSLFRISRLEIFLENPSQSLQRVTWQAS